MEKGGEIAPPTGAQRPWHRARKGGGGGARSVGATDGLAGLPMIRNVLVMGKSGLVLFSREFANSVQQVCSYSSTGYALDSIRSGVCCYITGT